MSIPPSLRSRLVRYDELQPCTNAFIDARSPGSDRKENFTIIGPGVAENPHQHVHIREAHGFNIGGARQPPHCTNSLHSHLTEEVFIIHQGSWRFFWGEHGDAGEVLLQQGDTISIPVNMFRGFENVGDDTAFMFAVLGSDDPGRVLWAPHVIEKARGHGLVLLDNGSLVDTIEGESVPAGRTPVAPAERAELAHIRTPDVAQMAANVVRHPQDSAALAAGQARESAIIGAAPATLAKHGFTLYHLAFGAGGGTPPQAYEQSEVIMVYRGEVEWCADDGTVIPLATGDTFSVPRGMRHHLRAATAAEVFVVRGGDNALALLAAGA
ncbi:cupin domain-containing protein [Duganella aceris]|uniref:Cupin domain-containing protein n=1 Tax=Duganella aceris TaxID=2703883 RepID=A0ABX0FV26_9BURK|nr:cupin domain-containing protein [Duganella aceris]NGZ88304.1 cupin domain-containing protein [Duganella aceris]